MDQVEYKCKLPLEKMLKMDTIEITSEQNKNISSWSENNIDNFKKNIDSVNHLFSKFNLKVLNENTQISMLVNFNIDKDTIVLNLYKMDKESVLHTFEAEVEMSKQEYVDMIKNKVCKGRVINILFNKDYYNFNIREYKDRDELISITRNSALDFVLWYYNILFYSQLHKEIIIKQNKTHTKKVQSKKDKRAGKKPKIKLIKQVLIKLNTSNLNITDEERKHYERHTMGWNVRGYWRTYKSGKKVWVKPHIRGDKESVEGKTYCL